MNIDSKHFVWYDAGEFDIYRAGPALKFSFQYTKLLSNVSWWDFSNFTDTWEIGTVL